MIITATGIGVPIPVETGYDTCRVSMINNKFKIEFLSRGDPLSDEYICVPFLEVNGGVEYLVNIADTVFGELWDLKEKLKSVGIELYPECV